MQKNLFKLVTFVLVVVLSGCGLLPDKIDETKNWSAPKLYSEAMDQLQSGAYDKAIQYFEKLESRYPFGTYAKQAQMEVAYAQYKQGEQPLALAAIERFIKLHPNDPSVDYMYYLRGLVNFNDKLGILEVIGGQDPTERDSKATREAFDSFKQLVEKYPNSVYAPDAIARMKYLVNTMAQYEVNVARFYYRHGAYVAAIDRAQTSLKSYPDTPANEEALLIMVRSYDGLGLTDLRDDTSRVLAKNYPDGGTLANGTRPGKQKPWWRFWQKADDKAL
jgi:outer membrane protein assembly factor BamD